MTRRTQTYWCEECHEHHEVEVAVFPKQKCQGKRGWKPTGVVFAGQTFLNERTKEVMYARATYRERYILRSGRNKGKMIFRAVLPVKRTIR